MTRADSRTRPRIAAAVLVLYISLAVLTAWWHEPWADEAQSWLLARDSTPALLWTRLLHYEGTPGLWQTLLQLLIRLGLPYGGLNFIAAGAGTAAAWLILRHAPLPAFIRFTLPFTYYLFYQYGVVARSYSLLPVIVFACAMLYARAARHPEIFTVTALMLGALSLDGFVLATVIYGAFLLDTWRDGVSRAEARRNEAPRNRRRIVGAAFVFGAAAALLAWSAWPARDNQFVRHLNLSAARLISVGPALLRYAFTGEWITSAAAIILSLPFLFRNGSAAIFIVSALCLCAAHWLIYVNVWHIGAILLAWLFSMWIAAARNPLTPAATAAMALVVAFQLYWAADSAFYDWNHAYSGSREAASFLKTHPETAQGGLFLAGFSTEALKPYFPAMELQRMTHSHGAAYWDWSSRGRGNDPEPLVRNHEFGYFIAGYKIPSERAHWADVAAVAGFDAERHFEGNLFWRTGVLETESFDLYRRSKRPGVNLSSSIEMGDPATARQLISGFGGIEDKQWRWTAQHFSAVLRRPEGAEASGARLTLDFFIPGNQIRDLGALTLSGFVNGSRVGGEEYFAPGEVHYVRNLSAQTLASELTMVEFSFDKVRPPSAEDDRELSAIARSLRLEKQ
jgi:hypothetical protein